MTAFSDQTIRVNYSPVATFLLMVALLHGGFIPAEAQEIPLAAALEAEGLPFSASSSQDVFGQENANGGTDDGVFLRVGGTLTASITGPADLQWTKSSGSLTCRLDGLEVITESLPSADEDRVEIPAGLHQISWTATPGKACWMYSVTHIPAALLSLEDAIGGAGLTWQASPEVSFFSDSAGGGLACLYLPQAPTAPQFYGLETTVTGPGVMSLRWKMRTTRECRILLNGVPYKINSRYWTPTDIFIPPGVHTMTLAPPAPTVTGTVAEPVFLLLDEAVWKPQQSTPLEEALDAPELTFTTGGGGVWQGVSANGTDFARTANLASNQSAWIETSVTGPGLLRFELSKTGNAYSPGFLLDGLAKTVRVNAPGFIYSLNSFGMPAGTHTLRWSVSQPQLYGHLPAAGQSAVLDAVSWLPFNPQPVTAWGGGAGFSLTASANDWRSVAGPDRDGGGSLHPLTVSGELAWLEASVTGPAALEFSIYSAGENLSSTATVTLDGVRSLNAVLPDFLTGMTGWTAHLLHIPDGLHTVRWTLPADRPLIWLDAFRLTPASADLSAAAELPEETTWSPLGERRWCAISRPDLPDGDAIAVESGFYWNGYQYPENALAFSISGPGRLTLRARSAQHPVIVVDDIFSAAPTTWSDEPNGWSATTFTLPPGGHRVAVSPQGVGTLLLDRAEWMPLPGPSLADVFPLSGVTWSTSPELPFHGFADPGLIAQPSAILTVTPGSPGSWLEASLTGPGTFSFSERVFGGQGMESFRVLVDGQPVAAVDEHSDYCNPGSIDFLTAWPAASRRYAVSLPAGRHTIRWVIPAGTPTTYTALLALHGMTFTAASAFSAVLENIDLVFLHGEFAVPQALTDADGTPLVRISSGVGPQVTVACERPLLNTRTSAPGFFKFRYRSAPGTWPQDAACYVMLRLPDIYGTESYHSLTHTAAWRELELFVPDRTVMVQWLLPPNVPGLDLGSFTFMPVTPVPLNVALGIPGIAVTTSPVRPWQGWLTPDGQTFVTPSFGDRNAGPWPLMEATVSGPALVSWNYWFAPGQSLVWEDMDGLPYSSASLSGWPVPYPLSAHEMVIPAGVHTVQWFTPQPAPGFRIGIEGMHIRPLPLSYVEWRPPLPGGESEIRAPFPSVDYDSDGLTNLEEFTWRTDPCTPNLPVQPVSAITGEHLTVSVPAPRPLSDGVQVFFESSSDLHQWQRATTELLPAPPAGQVNYRFTNPVSSSPRLYLRLRAEFAE